MFSQQCIGFTHVSLSFSSSFSVASSVPAVWRSGCSGQIFEEASRVQSEEGGFACSQSAAEGSEGESVLCSQLPAAESS